MRRQWDKELSRFEAESEQQTQNGILLLRDMLSAFAEIVQLKPLFQFMVPLMLQRSRDSVGPAPGQRTSQVSQKVQVALVLFYILKSDFLCKKFGVTELIQPDPREYLLKG